MRKKKILIIVFILLCALTGISVGHYFWKESKKMTGVEWFAEQESYVKQISGRLCGFPKHGSKGFVFNLERIPA